MIGASVLVRREVGGLGLGRTRYAPGAFCPTHRHENARLVVVLRGTFAERYGGRARRAVPYLAFYRPPEETHDERFGPEGATCISVDIPAGWAARTGAPLPSEASHVGGSEPAGRIDELDAEVGAWDGASPPAVEALVLELLALLAGRSPPPAAPRWWRRAEELLHDAFRERLSLQRLSAEADVHPVHLARTFRARTGRSVGAALRELRLAWARAELVRSDTPVAAIAAAAGFSDESHLCRTMKRLTGETPGALRRWGRRR